MSHNAKQGRLGENTAAAFLLAKDYEILIQNYRSGRAEIDIIARKEKTLIFVEVKLRRSNNFGFPEEAVSERKRLLFIEAAESYVEATNWLHDLRFDIVAITQSPTGMQIHHIEDAFH